MLAAAASLGRGVFRAGSNPEERRQATSRSWRHHCRATRKSHRRRPHFVLAGAEHRSAHRRSTHNTLRHSDPSQPRMKPLNCPDTGGVALSRAQVRHGVHTELATSERGVPTRARLRHRLNNRGPAPLPILIVPRAAGLQLFGYLASSGRRPSRPAIDHGTHTRASGSESSHLTGLNA